jgi:DNA-binding GntR family transcriptional regulator
LHDEILARLRDHIVEGNIPGGGRVPERQLCAMLGISRTPLREALKVLASERPRATTERARSRRTI